MMWARHMWLLHTVCRVCALSTTGGTFLLDITIPESYPFNPPKVGHCVAVCVHHAVHVVVCRQQEINELETPQSLHWVTERFQPYIFSCLVVTVNS